MSTHANFHISTRKIRGLDRETADNWTRLGPPLAGALGQTALRGSERSSDHPFQTVDKPPGRPQGAVFMVVSSLIVMCGAFLAAVLRGLTGFGFAIAAVPVLSLVLPPTRVVPLTVVLQLLASSVDFRAAARITEWRSVLWLSPGMIVGTPLGLWLLTRLSANEARLIIGLLLIGSVAVLGRGLRLPERPSHWVAGLVGVISGAMNGVAGMSGPPVVAYLMALPHSTMVMRATSLVFFTFTAIVAIVPFTLAGLIDRHAVLLALLAWPTLFVGTHVGAMVFRRTKPHHHRRIALTILSGLAMVLIVRALRLA